MALNSDQQSDFVEFGRIISCDDSAIVRQLRQAATDLNAWAEANWDDPFDDWGEVESPYPTAMIKILVPYLIGFWHNMGDLASWIVGSAKARGIKLDSESATRDLKAVDGVEWTSKWAFVEAAIRATSDTLEHQALRLYMVPNPYEDPVYACVVTEPESKLLDALQSWTDGADLFEVY